MNLFHISKIFETVAHQSPVYTLCQGSGNHFFSGGSDGMVKEWQADPFTLRRQIWTQEPIYALAFDDITGSLIAGTVSGNLVYIDFNQPNQLKKISLPGGMIMEIKIIENNRYLLVTNASGMLFSVHRESGKITSRQLSQGKIRSVFWNSRENIVFTGSAEGNILVASWPELVPLRALKISAMAVNKVIALPQKDVLLAGGRDAHLYAVNLISGKTETKIPAHYFAIYDIILNEESAMIYTASRDKSIKIWNADTLDFYGKIDGDNHKGHSHSVNKILWLQDRQCLVSTGDDRSIIGWKFELNRAKPDVIQ